MTYHFCENTLFAFKKHARNYEYGTMRTTSISRCWPSVRHRLRS